MAIGVQPRPLSYRGRPNRRGAKAVRRLRIKIEETIARELGITRTPTATYRYSLRKGAR